MPLLRKRVELLCKLGQYMLSDEAAWIRAQERAIDANAWFTPESIHIAVNNIVSELLQKDKLEQWVSKRSFSQQAKTVGIVMAGNIPLVGFHDFLCVFISGHKPKIKLSSKDEVLFKHLVEKLVEWDPAVSEQVEISEMLKDCDAYIATGSNNTARYFESYFGKYPNIIRRNRTSVAVLDGTETDEELHLLAKDVFTYFGLGCRNVTQICVPEDYDFIKMLDVFTLHGDIINHNKYKNNYDYFLAIYLLNKVPYLDNGSLLVVENNVPFSAVAVLHYKRYKDKATVLQELNENPDIQCVISREVIPFGDAQKPGLSDYADGVDTMHFLESL
jgi:hypothetical protein